MVFTGELATFRSIFTCLGLSKVSHAPSSFVGVIVYWFFATSKDITIGPVAVMSQLTGTIILNVQAKNHEYTGPQIAAALAILAGAFIFVLGAVRLGFIVDFIPLPAIAAFMTGSALNICSGQVSTMLGEVGVNTRVPTYLIIINTLKVCTLAFDFSARPRSDGYGAFRNCQRLGLMLPWACRP
jgi:MFS superfamily sulfate permease-like transporter